VNVLVLLEAGLLAEVLELTLVSYGSEETLPTTDVFLAVAANIKQRENQEQEKVAQTFSPFL
jgi:hypothetical protein